MSKDDYTALKKIAKREKKELNDVARKMLEGQEKAEFAELDDTEVDEDNKTKLDKAKTAWGEYLKARETELDAYDTRKTIFGEEETQSKTTDIVYTLDEFKEEFEKEYGRYPTGEEIQRAKNRYWK